ncbi:hypothetical protein GCG54_00009745 [Colletotrichum gloeosporioides]|uniref:Uncharacterized protein n=1 Tax=Colletotrichum gloeosporioides TaxID=474922 RepID=A0A8H4CFZ5_COLGL|nr:uncharacterized protein GCG54_00009745 [Colletotrichum gloeosporioides]KAF3803049.1 hypothetical protein GCG54_00009745 [Colletotrichum gloeosporioides]
MDRIHQQVDLLSTPHITPVISSSSLFRPFNFGSHERLALEPKASSVRAIQRHKPRHAITSSNKNSLNRNHSDTQPALAGNIFFFSHQTLSSCKPLTCGGDRSETDLTIQRLASLSPNMCDFTKNYYIYTSCIDPGAHFFRTSVDGNRNRTCGKGPHERYIVVPGHCPLCGG